MNGPLYLGYYDPDPKRPTAAKLAEAARRYELKHGRPARVALVHADDLCEAAGLVVRPSGYVARHTFLIGEED